MDEWLTMKQAAPMLGVSYQYLKTHRGDEGRNLPAGFQRSPGGKVLFKRSEIEALISRNYTKLAAKPHDC